MARVPANLTRRKTAQYRRGMTLSQLGDARSPRDPDRLLAPADLANVLQLPERTLQTWRYQRTGPAFLRLGRHVRYRWSDVANWLAERQAGTR